MIISLALTLLAISSVLIVLNYVICYKPTQEREKPSIFECGFDPSASSRLPFSMHFFLVALIFLIFDVEISLLVPIPLLWVTIYEPFIMWLFISVVMILLGGALVEWVEGSLEWHS